MSREYLKLVPFPPPHQYALEPEAEKFVESFQNPTPLDLHSPLEIREALEKIQAQSSDHEFLETENIQVPFRHGESVSVQILRPRGWKQKWPLVLYLHGGGWISGSEKSYHRLLSELCLGSNAAVAFVNFSLSPEAHYPLALEQCYAAAEYLAHHGDRHQLDSKHMAIAGDSAGANLATVLSRWSLERKGPSFLCQILFYPVTDAAMETPSYKQYSDGPWLNKAMMNRYWTAYEPNVEKRLHPSLSPLRTKIEALRGLPPALVITGENDVLRDEGEAYAHLLVEAGVNVIAIRVLGTIPDFIMLNALAQSEATRNALDLAYSRLKSAFSTN